jgi:hypothetical protein
MLKYFVVVLFFYLPQFQCAVCYVQSGSRWRFHKPKAVNDGIVYLMVIPYVLVAAIGYAVYRMRKRS